jgi:acetyltransferase-like isoleucine patch superfamily enzyme
MTAGENVIHETADIHPSAMLGYYNVIGPGVSIGEGVRIGNHNVIQRDCTIGVHSELMSHIELRPGTVIGESCYVDSGVKSSGKNRIGDKVTLRYDSIIARGCVIESNTYICPQVMTNNLDHHGVEVGGAHVGRGCFIGTQTVLGAGITIADKVVVGSCSLVTRDIPEQGVYAGVPARLRRKE